LKVHQHLIALTAVIGYKAGKIRIGGDFTMKKICMSLAVFSLAAFFLLAGVSMAPAQQAGPFYVGVFGSYVMPEDLDTDHGDEIDLDDSWGLGIKGGYIIPQVKFLAVELEYTYLGEQDVDESGVDGDISSHNVMANILFRYPEGKIHPFVGGGLGVSNATAEVDSVGPYDVDYDDDDTAIASQFIAGVNFELAPNLSAELVYKYFYSEYEFDDEDVEAGNHIFQIGVNYHF